jgi:dynein heavy chain
MEVDSGDASQLRLVMGCMRDIRNRTDKTDASFEPLRKTVQLLKKYGIILSEVRTPGRPST